MTVYLCGGINGLGDSDCKDWRDEAFRTLSAAGVATLDPMRRDYRGKEADSVSEIIAGDLEDIEASDVMLVNAARPSWGTAMETLYAFRTLGKRVVLFNTPPNPSPWLVGHSHARFGALAEALAEIVRR